MAARRLLFLLIAMLVISSFAAALVPIERDGGTDSTTRPAEQTGAGGPTAGKTIERTVRADAKRPPTVRAALGDRIVLSVAADRLDQVEIPALGELEDVEPATPAVFDLIPADPGRYPVRLVEADRRVATLVIEKPKPENSEKRLQGDEKSAEDRESKPDQKARGNG